MNVDEKVVKKIPALLPPETIEAIKERSIGDKTYTHGQLKNPYLLGRVVFCAECGNAMFGQTNHNNHRYYRHARGRKNPCNPGLWVPAEVLEQAAIIQLFAMFGNLEILKDAVERAIPNAERIEELHARLIDIGKDILTIKTKKDRIIDAVAEGLLQKDDIKEKIDKLLEQEDALMSEKEKIQSELSNLPDYRRQLSKLAKAARQASAESRSCRLENLTKMSYKQKRNMIQTAFSGKDHNGRRLGVYVRKDAEGQWLYEVRGIIHPQNPIAEPTFKGKLPMKENEAQDILGVDKEFSNS